MIDEPYMTKDVKRDYKSKHYGVAVHPSGNQYHIKEGAMDHFLRIRGFTNVTQAKKAGWKFKEVSSDG